MIRVALVAGVWYFVLPVRGLNSCWAEVPLLVFRVVSFTFVASSSVTLFTLWLHHCNKSSRNTDGQSAVTICLQHTTYRRRHKRGTVAARAHRNGPTAVTAERDNATALDVAVDRLVEVRPQHMMMWMMMINTWEYVCCVYSGLTLLRIVRDVRRRNVDGAVFGMSDDSLLSRALNVYSMSKVSIDV